MNFALLGDDPGALALARFIVTSPGHRLRCTVAAPRTRAALLPLQPGLESKASWEELLSDTDVEAIIVAGHGEEVQHAARQLASAGKALVIVPAPEQSSTFIYELTLIHDESPFFLFPVFSLRAHPLVQELAAMIEEGNFGKIHHLQLERRIVSKEGETSTPLMSLPDLAAALLPDVDLLRYLGGEYNEISASRAGGSDRGASLATVTLSGASAPQANWSASAHRLAPEWRLSVAGEAGTAVLSGNPETGTLTLDAGEIDGASDIEDVSCDSGPWLLEQISAGFAGKAVKPDWTDITRAFEFVDAVERSIRRRRTIDLYFEKPSERSIFKTQMTAVGCSLLMLTLVAVVGYLCLAAVVELPAWVKHAAKFVLFLPLGLFLLLQLLLWLTRPSSPE